MLDKKALLDERDFNKKPLTESELGTLIGDRSYLDFLNPRNELYRTLRLKEKPPSRRQALELMAKNPNLIRRPIARLGNECVLGFDDQKLAALLK